MDNTVLAKRLLVNYIQMVARAAGVTWHSDYTAELEECIDCIIEAAVIKAQEDTDGR